VQLPQRAHRREADPCVLTATRIPDPVHLDGDCPLKMAALPTSSDTPMYPPRRLATARRFIDTIDHVLHSTHWARHAGASKGSAKY
jgi:hypothetical protein